PFHRPRFPAPPVGVITSTTILLHGAEPATYRSGAAHEVIGYCRRSVDGQDLPTTGAAARAANVRSIAAGRLHHDVEASRSKDHGGCNSGRELRMTSHPGGEGGAIEDHNGRGNEMAAGRSDDERGR